MLTCTLHAQSAVGCRRMMAVSDPKSFSALTVMVTTCREDGGRHQVCAGFPHVKQQRHPGCDTALPLRRTHLAG